MVRNIIAACFVLALAIPAFAQEDYPRIQTSMGYANLSFPDLTTGVSGHHSGFANQTSFNLTRSLGLDNYMGIYGLGTGVTLISDFFGGKAMYRTSKFVPYALAGIGVGYFTASTSSFYGSQSSFATRYGAGFDVPINDSLAWKVEVSRMGFHIQTNLNSTWTSGTNISGGIVFTLSN
jgi:outer membrane protein with beta-barrel domain